MLTFLKRPLYVLSNKIRRARPGNLTGKKWVADFSKPGKSLFDIKTESAYNAYLSKGSLALGLKKTNCIAWAGTTGPGYDDQIITARFRLDSLGGYAAAGLVFRAADEETYYLALVSNKNYFRLDAVKYNSPRPLVGWTEAPNSDGRNMNLNIIAYGAQMIFLLNDRWIAEISDDAIGGGRLGFALASYEGEVVSEYSCEAWLDYLSVDSRSGVVEHYFNQWTGSAEISAESRLLLAETFAAMGCASLSLSQIQKAWERRREAAKSVTATYTEMRTRKELLLSGRMAYRLDRLEDAEECFDACLELGLNNPEGKEALAAKANILEEREQFAELKNLMLKHSADMDMNSALYDLLARAHWKLHEYQAAADAWDRAFDLEKENGAYAVKAGNALELLGSAEAAAERFLAAGKIFLRQDKRAELAAMVSKLVSMGGQHWEARVLAGKWAFSVEDYRRAETEFAVAERLRRTLRPKPAADPAASYLRGLIFMLKGKHTKAARFLGEAARLAPDYGLFRFKQAENRFLLNGGADGKAGGDLAGELQTALDLMGDDPGAEMTGRAGTLLLQAGDVKSAAGFFDKALAVAPDNEEYIANREACRKAAESKRKTNKAVRRPAVTRKPPAEEAKKNAAKRTPAKAAKGGAGKTGPVKAAAGKTKTAKAVSGKTAAAGKTAKNKAPAGTAAAGKTPAKKPSVTRKSQAEAKTKKSAAKKQG